MNSDKYILLVNLIIGFVSILLLILTALHQFDAKIINDIFLNLGTELLAIAIIFFFINNYFLKDILKQSKKTDKILNILDSKPLANDFFLKNKNSTKLYETATKIDICGVVLSSEIDKNIGLLKSKILQGANIRIMIIDPNSEATKMALLRSDNIDNDEYYRKKLEVTFDNINFLLKSISKNITTTVGSLEVKMLQYSPSFGIIKTENNNSKNIIVELYPHHIGYDNPPIFMINGNVDLNYYQYFEAQFNTMWERAKKYEKDKE